MKEDLFVREDVIIPGYEIDIATSRAGGPGGQHVNKTDTRITVRWNVINTIALNEEQKKIVLQNLESRLTTEGDLIIHNSSSRSQQQNKKAALDQLVRIVSNALYVPKERTKTRTPKKIKEERLKEKKHRSEIKKMRSKKLFD